MAGVLGGMEVVGGGGGGSADLSDIDTLVKINANFVDGTTLDDDSDPRDPELHSGTHATGQPDAIAAADIGAVATADLANYMRGWIHLNKSAGYAAQANEAITTTNTWTLTLPAAPAEGTKVALKNSDGGTITVDGNGNNIDGVASYNNSTQYQQDVLYYNGSQWERW